MATRHILGRFAVGTRCAYGERFISFASANRLVVFCTRFQPPYRHLLTGFSNDGRTRNQLDRMLMRYRWASSVIVYGVYNGAQTGSEYGLDHAMVRAVFLFLARPLNLATMSDLRSGVWSQTQEVLHLPGVF